MIIPHLAHKQKTENLDRLRFEALYSNLTRYALLLIYGKTHILIIYTISYERR